jgi:D-glycero-alpha-D-manno-heptose 1-phosphate guanylyltransferase
MKLHGLILAGGRGTRLQSAVPDLPKALAPINGKPFLFYLLEAIARQEIIDEVIISVGYMADSIVDAVGDHFAGMKIRYAREEQPLGTGGAIRYAMSENPSFTTMLVLNGDTFADIDLHDFLSFHTKHSAGFTLAAKEMQSFDRYGSLTVDQSGRILKFNEKKFVEKGLISSGAYLIQKDFFNSVLGPYPQAAFSMENDILARTGRQFEIFAFVSNTYFIDIGIPEDYARAQFELPGLV